MERTADRELARALTRAVLGILATVTGAGAAVIAATQLPAYAQALHATALGFAAGYGWFLHDPRSVRHHKSRR